MFIKAWRVCLLFCLLNGQYSYLGAFGKYPKGIFQNGNRRILNGEEATETRPYMVYLRPDAEEAETHPDWLCGGVIIHEIFILTSAACIEDVKRFYVVSGTYNWVAPDKSNECIKNGAIRAVWKCVPKSYVYDGRQFDNIRWMMYDLAIVKVEEPFNFLKRVRGCEFVPSYIPYNNITEDLEKPGTVGSIAGWGTTERFGASKNDLSKNISTRSEGSQNSPVLLEADVLLITKKKCKSRWPAQHHDIIDKHMVCAKSTDTKALGSLCMENDLNCKDIVYEDYEEEEEDDEITKPPVDDDEATTTKSSATEASKATEATGSKEDEKEDEEATTDKTRRSNRRYHVQHTGQHKPSIDGSFSVVAYDHMQKHKLHKPVDEITTQMTYSGDETKRMNSQSKASEEVIVHDANHRYEALDGRRNDKKFGGFCQNDHGGPLIVGRGKEAVVVGIISACMSKARTHECYGPFLFTSIFKYSHLIACATEKVEGVQHFSTQCRNALRSTKTELKRTKFDWRTSNASKRLMSSEESVSKAKVPADEEGTDVSESSSPGPAKRNMAWTNERRRQRLQRAKEALKTLNRSNKSEDVEKESNEEKKEEKKEEIKEENEEDKQEEKEEEKQNEKKEEKQDENKHKKLRGAESREKGKSEKKSSKETKEKEETNNKTKASNEEKDKSQLSKEVTSKEKDDKEKSNLSKETKSKKKEKKKRSKSSTETKSKEKQEKGESRPSREQISGKNKRKRTSKEHKSRDKEVDEKISKGNSSKKKKRKKNKKSIEDKSKEKEEER